MIFKKLGSTVAFASALAFATPALADWKSVETDHFIYYSEDDTDAVRQNVVQLEMFDTLVRALTGNQRPPSEVKVRIFELKDMDILNRYLGSRGIGGFYNNNDMGPYLFTFREAIKERASMFRTNKNTVVWAPEVRQHEYLHHYMYQYFNSNYPSWYSEGFAEYYGTMAFPEENVVEIGHAPQFRMNALRGGAWMPAEKLLTARSYAEAEDTRALYAQGWLLTHLAARNPERGKQLQDYLKRISAGEEYKSAAEAAFGDLNQLDKELRKHKDDIRAVRLSLKPMDVGSVEIDEMSKFESDIFDYMMRLNIGIRESDREKIRSHVRELRSQNPNHPLGIEVQARLAQLAEDWEEEESMGDLLLAADPESRLGKYFKGHALVLKAGLNKPEAEYEEGRRLLAEAAKAAENEPEPLIDFYRSYLLSDGIPPAEAQNALMSAVTMLPGHRDLRMYAARDFEWRGMIDEAIFMISPLAFGTFDGDDRQRRRREEAMAELIEKYGRIIVEDTPKEMLERLEAKRDGRWDEETQSVIAK